MKLYRCMLCILLLSLVPSLTIPGSTDWNWAEERIDFLTEIEENTETRNNFIEWQRLEAGLKKLQETAKTYWDLEPYTSPKNRTKRKGNENAFNAAIAALTQSKNPEIAARWNQIKARVVQVGEMKFSLNRLIRQIRHNYLVYQNYKLYLLQELRGEIARAEPKYALLAPLRLDNNPNFATDIKSIKKELTSFEALVRNINDLANCKEETFFDCAKGILEKIDPLEISSWYAKLDKQQQEHIKKGFLAAAEKYAHEAKGQTEKNDRFITTCKSLIMGLLGKNIGSSDLTEVVTYELFHALNLEHKQREDEAKKLREEREKKEREEQERSQKELERKERERQAKEQEERERIAKQETIKKELKESKHIIKTVQQKTPPIKMTPPTTAQRQVNVEVSFSLKDRLMALWNYGKAVLRKIRHAVGQLVS
ncbi:MAG: hypothetical protein M1549_03055 [Candidatus Dependentiae bacterium]|nr:hypothetical protein [Candidatus Dependentiae bacterium]